MTTAWIVEKKVGKVWEPAWYKGLWELDSPTIPNLEIFKFRRGARALRNELKSDEPEESFRVRKITF